MNSKRSSAIPAGIIKMLARYEIILKSEFGSTHRVEAVGSSERDVAGDIFDALHKKNPYDLTQLISVEKIPGETKIQELVPTVHT